MTSPWTSNKEKWDHFRETTSTQCLSNKNPGTTQNIMYFVFVLTPINRQSVAVLTQLNYTKRTIFHKWVPLSCSLAEMSDEESNLLAINDFWCFTVNTVSSICRCLQHLVSKFISENVRTWIIETVSMCIKISIAYQNIN